MKQLKFSLIIGTLNRPKILSVCLDKLNKQSYLNFETIIVDQSDNEETEKQVKGYSSLDIKYLKVDFKGLSKARNKAISMMTGDYFCLIDDDADYSSDYLKIAAEKAINNPEKIISGYILDNNTNKSIVEYQKIRRKEKLNLREIVRLCPSAGLIFPASTIKKVGFFDEQFGVGAKFGATEETDYLLRCRKEGYSVAYYPELHIRHPILIDGSPCAEVLPERKVWSYAMGGGALYKKHLYYSKEYELLPMLFDNLGRLYIKSLVKRTDYTNARYKGFIEGWKGYTQP